MKIETEKQTAGHSIIYHLATMLKIPKNDWMKSLNAIKNSIKT